eukprot:gene29963-37102_t
MGTDATLVSDSDSGVNFARGSGLKNRRDVKAVEGMESQVQSVSQRRVFDKAYHTARMPPLNVMLDYSPVPTPSLRFVKLIPPVMEPLIEFFPMSSLASPSSSSSGDSEYLLHMDRLVPSSDYLVAIQPEVLWRFSLYRCCDLSAQYFMATESQVASYVADIILQRSSSVPVGEDWSGNDRNSGDLWRQSPLQELRSSTVVYMTPPNQTVGLQWYSVPSMECQCCVTISILCYNYPDATELSPQTIRVEICVTTAGRSLEEQGASSFYMETTPAELRHLLHVPSAPLQGCDWWVESQRVTDFWPLLIPHLHITSTIGTHAVPNGLCFGLVERTAADRVEGALSTLEALSCASELLDLVSLKTVSVDPSSYPVAIELHALRETFLIPSSLGPGRRDSKFSQSVDPKEDVASLSSLSHGGYIAAAHLKSGTHAADDELMNGDRLDRDAGLRRDILAGRWEDIVNYSGHNLSLVASGSVPLVSQVPGACEHGRRGLWFADMNGSVECSQAAARMFRDPHLSTTDSVLVNMTMALDSALLFPSLLAWEDYSTFPVAAPAEESPPHVPLYCAPPNSLRLHTLRSPIQDRMSYTVTVFGSLPVEGVDYLPLDAPRKPSGYCRHFPSKNQFGFRQQVTVTLLGVDPVLATMVFGVTRLGALPNTLGVNTRNIWHCTIPITEHINRPRESKDYHYILSNLTSRGCNDPTSYTTRMRAAEMVGLTSSAFKDFEDQYGSIQELRSVFHKQLALDSKIEKVQADLKLREKMQVNLIRTELQRTYEKRLRKATKSEIGWKGRHKMSSLVELQGNWERRRDDRSGLYFFHRLLPPQGRAEEKFAETCQWEVPAQWDGDPLSSASAIGTVVEGSVEFDPMMRGQTQPAAGPSRRGARQQDQLGSGASLYSELDEEDLDLYDMPQSTAQKRTVAGVPQHARGETNDANSAFDQPPDSWFPGSVTRASVASRGRLGAASEKKPQKLFNPQNRRSSAQSEDSGMNTAAADQSVAESLAPTIDTVNLEHIAEQLVSSDELMRVIARRLGLPETQVVSADDLSSVFSMTSGKERADGKRRGKGAPYAPLNAPRDEWADDLNEPEFDSDDDLWSDDDFAAGDFDEEQEMGAREDMPETQLEAAQLKRRQWREQNRKEDISVPLSVPYLHLPKANATGTANDEETREEVFGWRRLPRPDIKPGFLSNSLLTHTRGPDKTSSNTLNSPVFLMPISPVDACKYVPQEFTALMESIFVPDAKKDMERSIATVERNVRREEELSRNLPTDDLLLFGEAKEFTSVDAYLARQQREDQAAVADPKEEAREKAILAAKSTNIAQMEDALAEDIPINSADEFGNTLLILAAQQGSRRMCKFLLRRGANINLQSLAGNTPLHYCYAYSQIALGEYLKSKGADDSIINVDGLTCYEGLSRESMNEEYGDNEELEEEEDDDEEYS